MPGRGWDTLVTKTDSLCWRVRPLSDLRLIDPSPCPLFSSFFPFFSSVFIYLVDQGLQFQHPKYPGPFIFPSHLSSTIPSYTWTQTFAFSVPSPTYPNAAEGITQQGRSVAPVQRTTSSLKRALNSLKFLIVFFRQLQARAISTTPHKDYSLNLQCSISLYSLPMSSSPALERKQMKEVWMGTL